MTAIEFEDLVDCHGGDLQRWPSDRQAAAAALLKSSSTARKTLEAMQEVEQLLAASKIQPLDHIALAARASRVAQVRPFNRVVLKAGWSAAAAALLAIGILVGRTDGVSQVDDPSTTLARTLASTETFNVE